MQSPRQDYYAVLGVLRDSSPEEIKRAYYAAARRLHPDRNTVLGETEIFLQVQQAYEVLSNPQRRALYDAALPKNEATPPVLQWKVEYSRPSLVHLEEPQLIYALWEASPPEMDQGIPTMPLNVCLVLDRSTSMQGQKMDVAKATAIEIISMLRPEDLFGLVVFGDRAEVLMPSGYQMDYHQVEGRIRGLQTGGATEIFRGLEAGLAEVRRNLGAGCGNHLILLTDGHTYGDEQVCLQLAEEAADLNIGISAFGIGSEWNDIFLDALAARTGGSSTYVAAPREIRRMLIEKFRALAKTLVDDVVLEPKAVEGVQLRNCTRLQPDGGPIEIQDLLHLGPILQDQPLQVLLEFVIEPSACSGDVVTLLDGSLTAGVRPRPIPIPPIRIRLDRPVAESSANAQPPPAVLQALSRIALYHLQQRARQEVSAGEYESATRHLKNLASRLLALHHYDLAKTALLEAEDLEKGRAYSLEGQKQIKYGTRALLLRPAESPE